MFFSIYHRLWYNVIFQLKIKSLWFFCNFGQSIDRKPQANNNKNSNILDLTNTTWKDNRYLLCDYWLIKQVNNCSVRYWLGYMQPVKPRACFVDRSIRGWLTSYRQSRNVHVSFKKEKKKIVRKRWLWNVLASSVSLAHFISKCFLFRFYD